MSEVVTGLVVVTLLLSLPCLVRASAPTLVTTRSFDGVDYDVLPVQPGQRLQLFWKGDDGKPLETFGALEAHCTVHDLKLLFATNGGIFEPGYRPTGLHVEAGRLLCPLNTSDGTGNFYLQPNGCFFVDARGAHVVSTKDYAALNVHPDLALQSGPLLVEKGTIHGRFRRRSTSSYVRSGVGVTATGQVVVAISRQAVNLYGFARFFRDGLACPSALYLDGGISQFHVPGTFVLRRRRRFATFIAVVDGSGAGGQPSSTVER